MSTIYLGGRRASPARTELLAATSRLSPVGLAEILEHAALDTRADLKYVLPLGTLPALIARLGPRWQVLEIDGRRAFGYQSVYFDTSDLLCYRQHLQGKRHRFKVRTRTYLDSADCVLEVKTRGARGATVKHRRPHPADQSHQLNDDDYRFVEEQIQPSRLEAPLHPVFATAYHRLTLVNLSDGVRMTCDADLVLRNARTSAEGLRDRLLVETKAASAKTALTHTFHDLGVRPVVFSKYCVAVALLGDNVPANPWQRTLRRHFAGADLGGPGAGSGSAVYLTGIGRDARRRPRLLSRGGITALADLSGPRRQPDSGRPWPGSRW
jgi:hypothetical protein